MTDRRVMARAGLTLAALAGLGLGVALAAERWGGLVPCALCLWERWPYRVAAGLGVLAAVWPGRAGWALGAAGVVMLAGAGLGVLHVGVEQRWWPSPLPECAAPQLGGGTMAERLARMPPRPAKPCDEPIYLVPGLPVSMAAMNALFAAALVGGLGVAVAKGRGR